MTVVYEHYCNFVAVEALQLDFPIVCCSSDIMYQFCTK